MFKLINHTIHFIKKNVAHITRFLIRCEVILHEARYKHIFVRSLYFVGCSLIYNWNEVGNGRSLFTEPEAIITCTLSMLLWVYINFWIFFYRLDFSFFARPSCSPLNRPFWKIYFLHINITYFSKENLENWERINNDVPKYLTNISGRSCLLMDSNGRLLLAV